MTIAVDVTYAVLAHVGAILL